VTRSTTRRRSPAAGGSSDRPRRARAQGGSARAPHRRGSSIRWDRVGRTALLLVLGAIVLLYVPPVSHWVTQSQTADRYEAELEQLEREREELRQRAAELRGPAAIEREARRLGMVREGERALSVENLPPP
jgi:cell division protein FtsB